MAIVSIITVFSVFRTSVPDDGVRTRSGWPQRTIYTEYLIGGIDSTRRRPKFSGKEPSNAINKPINMFYTALYTNYENFKHVESILARGPIFNTTPGIASAALRRTAREISFPDLREIDIQMRDVRRCYVNL